MRGQESIERSLKVPCYILNARKPNCFLLAIFLTTTLLASGFASFLLHPVSAVFPGNNGKIAFSQFDVMRKSWDIFTVWPNGGGSVRLTFTGSEYLPAWSADGSKIAFISGRTTHFQLYLMSAGGSGQVAVADSAELYRPSWSPDGTKIAFVGFADNGPQIYVINVDGTNKRPLTNWGINVDPAWSPDGSEIAFSSTMFGKAGHFGKPFQNIWVMDADTGNNKKQLSMLNSKCDSVECYHSFGPNWALDGSRIVFWTWVDFTGVAFGKRYYGTVENIWSMKPDGSGLFRVADSNICYGCSSLNFLYLQPSYSPDGSAIAFNRQTFDHNQGYWKSEIMLMYPDGTGKRELTIPTLGEKPDWQPYHKPSFYTTVCCSNSISLTLGSTAEALVMVNWLNGFSSPVFLSASWVGSAPTEVDLGLESVITPSPEGNATSPLIITSSQNASTGNFILRVTGTSGLLNDSVDLSVQVTAVTSTSTTTINSPDFSLLTCCSFDNLIPTAQGGNASSVIVVNSLNGFSAPVTLTASWVGPTPYDVNISFSSATTTPSPDNSSSSLLNVLVGSSVPIGAYKLQITGTSGSLSHTVDMVVQVVQTGPPSTETTTSTPSITASAGAGDFSISVSANILTVAQGSSVTTATTITSLSGFSAPVTLTASGLPPGLAVTFAPVVVTPPPGGAQSSLTTLAAAPSTHLGDYVITVTGEILSPAVIVHEVQFRAKVIPGVNTTSSTTTSTVSPSVLGPTVTAPPSTGGKCLIATATYGSELSPEVQLLRKFRDNSIMKTRAGSNFMVAFNAWYYSFSPYVASYLSTHWVERTIMKGVLYPLIGMLALSSATFHAASAYPEFAALLSGLAASSLIGAFYLGLPLSLLQAKVHRLRKPRAYKLVQRLLGFMFLGGLTALLFGEVVGSPIVLMTSSALTVLSTLFLSARCVAAEITKKIKQDESPAPLTIKQGL